jgi:hypothetical protein
MGPAVGRECPGEKFGPKKPGSTKDLKPDLSRRIKTVLHASDVSWTKVEVKLGTKAQI